MNLDQALITVMQGDSRNDAMLVALALEAIERLVPLKESKNTPLLSQHIAQVREETSTIFSLDNLKDVVNNLDFNSPTRMSRNGSKQIKLHRKVHPDENFKYLIFDMVNRVTAYSKLPPRLRKQVIHYCATVLFYDHGYKDVEGISSLDHTIR